MQLLRHNFNILFIAGVVSWVMMFDMMKSVVSNVDPAATGCDCHDHGHGHGPPPKRMTVMGSADAPEDCSSSSSSEKGEGIASAAGTAAIATKTSNSTTTVLLADATTNSDGNVSNHSIVPPRPYTDFPPPKEIFRHPVFVASLPKSATTSTKVYFGCGRKKSAHAWVRPVRQIKERIRLGKCMERNIRAEKPPFDGCGKYNVWADTGYANSEHECYYPSIDGLDAIYRAYPRATILLVIRNTTEWVQSLLNHRGLFRKWTHCENVTNLPKRKEDLASFYEWHNNRIKEFALDRPSLNYVEFRLSDPLIGEHFEQVFGIRATCWTRQNCGINLTTGDCLTAEEEA